MKGGGVEDACRARAVQFKSDIRIDNSEPSILVLDNSETFKNPSSFAFPYADFSVPDSALRSGEHNTYTMYLTLIPRQIEIA